MVFFHRAIIPVDFEMWWDCGGIPRDAFKRLLIKPVTWTYSTSEWWQCDAIRLIKTAAYKCGLPVIENQTLLLLHKCSRQQLSHTAKGKCVNEALCISTGRGQLGWNEKTFPTKVNVHKVHLLLWAMDHGEECVQSVTNPHLPTSLLWVFFLIDSFTSSCGSKPLVKCTLPPICLRAHVLSRQLCRSSYSYQTYPKHANTIAIF